MKTISLLTHVFNEQAQIRIARWVSVIGHPFLLMPILTGIIAYHVLPLRQALIAELIALGVVIVPAAIYTFVRVRRGTWGDLDVSNRRERNQFYGVLLPLLTIITVIAWIADVPPAIPLGSLAIIVLVASALVLNSWIKVSLHTGFAVFVALTLSLIKPEIASVALVLAVLVAWSRVILGRHTKYEVFIGAALGCTVGGVLIITIMK